MGFAHQFKIMKKLLFLSISVLIFNSQSIAKEAPMDETEAQKVWDEYHKRIKNRRLAQAEVLKAQLEEAGVSEETELYLDFTFFTPDEAGAIGIQEQLSENYEMTVKKDDQYWLIYGTTKPHTITLSKEQHMSWVEFMHDVALSYGCVFSTWTITDPESKQSFSNESISTAFD